MAELSGGKKRGLRRRTLGCRKPRLGNAVLDGANFRSASLKGANLEGADLRSAIYLDSIQLGMAIADSRAKLSPRVVEQVNRRR